MGPYSQAIRAGGLVFCSGQIALDPARGSLVGPGLKEQVRRAMENLRAVLAAADVSLDRVVKTTVFLTASEDFAAFNDVYEEYFSMTPPARSCVVVQALPKGARVEIEAIALAGGPGTAGGEGVR